SLKEFWFARVTLFNLSINASEVLIFKCHGKNPPYKLHFKAVSGKNKNTTQLYNKQYTTYGLILQEFFGKKSKFFEKKYILPKSRGKMQL
ncbi:MAG: hypothetical protein IJ035_09050, partial [Oscillospiraceae bacterium]|nr:hypothetical protein [Oscillospiraceae bacterium]